MRVPSLELIGRHAELADLEQFFRDKGRLPAAIVLEGEPGIGKTVLWRCAVEIARQQSYRVLSCNPVLAETRFSFASFRDLLGDALGAVTESLPVPQRRALAVALLREDPGVEKLDPGVLGVAFLGVLRALAAEQPVLVAVDDVQWLDPPTRSLLEFAARRLRGESVALLLAMRPPGPDGVPFVARGPLADQISRIELRPLSLGAVGAVLSDRLGISIPRPVLLRIHEVSRGNPLFALEIGRALEEGGHRLAPGEPLPIPTDLSALLGARIAKLPSTTREVLLTVALMSNPQRSLVETAMPRRASARLRDAAELGVVELDNDRVRFVHPLLASAVYAEASPGLRRRVHGRLAAIVPDPEQQTRHLALSVAAPDADIAAALDQAARGALARGGPASAAELAESAIALTPPEHADDIDRRSIEAAEYHLHAGDTARARVLLEDALTRVRPGDTRTAGLQGLATVRLREESFPAARSLLEQALAESGDPLRRAALELNLTVCLLQLGRLRKAAAHAREALLVGDALGDPGVSAAALTYLALLEFMLGGGNRHRLITRAVHLANLAEPGPRVGIPHVLPPDFSWAATDKWADELEAGRVRFEALRRRAEEEHHEGWLPAILFYLGELACWLGDFDLAARCADESAVVVEGSGSPTMRVTSLSLHALIDAHMGRVEEARSAAREVLSVCERTGEVLHRIRSHAVLGFVDLSLDDAESAKRHLDSAADMAATSGCVDPGVFRFVPDQIETLVRLGLVAEARTLLGDFETRARSLNRRSALAAAGRCRGLLLAAEGDLDGALRSLEAAVVAHQQVLMPFERARTLLILGSTLRRAKRKAAPRASLAEALAEFERLGTRLWADKARAELARVGGRPPAGSGLTASERRLAELVVEGRPNKEIAAALFVTPKTVETNLSRLYRKLGVRSRTELARRFAQKS